MKNFLIVVLALILGGSAGYFVYRYFLGGANQAQARSKNLANYTEPFQWGVTMGPSDLGNYQPEIWRKQIKVVKNLGAGWIRLRWDSQNADPFTRNDDEISYLTQYGLQTLLIIEQDPRKNYNVDNYKDGFNDGYSIASHYKDKIKFYQLINEGGAQSLREPTMNGQDASQYDETKYVKVSAYLRGLSEGIAKADPSAWRIVSLSYTHTGYLDKLINDKIDFDMIGLDWYDWMGPIQDKKMDSGGMFTDKLKSYQKPLIFTEVNAVPHGATKNSQAKTIVDENQQSQTISQTADWAWANKDYVKGFYVLSLLDGINNPNANVEYYGIVKGVRNSTGVGVPGDPRKSFYTYQDIIKKYSGQ